ncbi:MAG: toxin-antitoxin system YwqK family antitoxin [Bacteroidetes bacterium]|nr:toxin-antitoxin system YwqK family antitoxin [Bacteroidota bacterium]
MTEKSDNLELPNMEPDYLDFESFDKPTFTYFPDGKIKTETIFIDRENFIKEVVYDSTGRVIKITNYKKGGIKIGEHFLEPEVVRSGLAFTYYPDGVVQSLRYYVNGRVHWTEKVFSNSGSLTETVSYSNGKKKGPHVIYSKLNKKLSEINYEDNLPHGVAKYYYETGELKAEVSFKDGDKSGESKIYFDNGILKIKENLEGDIRTGTTETYYESGGIKEKWKFKDGLPNDECLFYYSDGSLYAKRNFEEGKEDGVSKYYYQGNKIKEEITYKGGSKDGPSREYDRSGNVKKEIVYKDGNIIAEKKVKVGIDSVANPHLENTTKQKLQIAFNYSMLFIITLLIIYGIYIYLIL